MIQGINVILNEAVKKGALQELKLADAIILIERDQEFPVACLLVTTRTSALLRKSMQVFFHRFITEFSSSLKNSNNLVALARAEEIIPTYFGFVPEFE